MSAIGRGDWVECIRRPWIHPSKQGRLSGVRPPTAGRLYRVRWIGEAVIGMGGVLWWRRPLFAPGLLVEGDNMPSTDCWPLDCFRPVYRPKADLIETLKAPGDAPVKEAV